jgi:hypothetical protein
VPKIRNRVPVQLGAWTGKDGLKNRDKRRHGGRWAQRNLEFGMLGSNLEVKFGTEINT